MPARWYFCKPLAQRFRLPTSFSSHVFWRDWEENPHGPGETSREVAADKGENTGYQGRCFLGQPDWFATGRLPASVLTDPLPDWPECCWQPERVRVGGIAAAGYQARGWVGVPRPYLADVAVGYGAAATLTPIFRWHSLAEYGLAVGAAFNLPPQIRGDVGVRYAPRGRMYQKPRVIADAQLGYVAPGAFVPGWPIVGLAQLGYANSAELERIPAVAGLVVAGYRPAADMVGPHEWAGAAACAYSPRALVSEIPLIRGIGQLGYAAAGLVRPVWSVGGRAQLGYAPAARGGPIYRYAGVCALAYGARSALVRSHSIAGAAAMQLTPKATFTYIPAGTPGASCTAAGQMTLGTTYGPFGFPATGAIDWWKVTVVGGHTYTITFTVAGAGGMSGVVAFGSCPSPTQQNTFGPGAPSSWTPSVSGDYYLELQKVGGTGTYTIKVA